MVALRGAQAIQTFTSPSAAQWTQSPDYSARDYLPLDEPGPVSDTLAAVRPAILVFARGDVWPQLLVQAAARNIPCAVIGATVRAGSYRLRWAARPIYRSLYQYLTWVGAATTADASRWAALGTPVDRIEVTGDPRHDQILERVPDFNPITDLIRWASDLRVLVAGSTHRRDEAVLLAAARHVLDRCESAALLIVPHEPTKRALTLLRSRAEQEGLPLQCWRQGAGPPDTRCVVVEELGVLLELYALGVIAYVGGGFHRERLHAVAEPIAWAVPVIVGPRAVSTGDASVLAACGGAAILPRHGSPALATRWLSWLEDVEGRAAAGLAARSCLHSGAARRTAEVLRGLVKVG